MGLDAVELMIEVEQAFDVQIPDDRAGGMYTVGDVFDYIVECRSNSDRSPESNSPGKVCLSAATFFSIRHALASEVDIRAQRLRPRAMVAQTIPAKSRRAVWSKLQQSLNLDFPRLRRSGWIVMCSTVLTAGAALGIAAMVEHRFNAYLVTVVSLALIGLVARLVTAPCAIHTGPGWTSFRGLSELVLAHNYARLSRRFNTREPADVWKALQKIVVDQLGVEPDRVTKDALLVEDLGAG